MEYTKPYYVGKYKLLGLKTEVFVMLNLLLGIMDRQFLFLLMLQETMQILIFLYVVYMITNFYFESTARRKT